MKIGIFIDNFFEPQKYKDPGVIAESLVNLGHQITIYCFNTNSLEFNGIAIKKVSNRISQSIPFWEQEKIDYLILYSWLSLRFSNLIKALKSANKKIILKLDSDGHLISPLKPTYLRTIGRSNAPKQLIIHALRFLQWSVFASLNSKKRLNQLLMSDAAIIESPPALINLKYSCEFWGQEKLGKKIIFIPDPVSFDIVNDSNIPSQRENIIICNGRWGDKQKNKSGLISVLSSVDLSGWKLIIIGPGAKKIKAILLKKKKDIKIEAIEKIDHHLISGYLKKSKIFFAPSNHESFNLAAAEALCCGCSLAGTPLESFFYFTNNNLYGSLSKNFNVFEIAKALKNEMDKWNQGKYQPQETSNYWREQLSPKNISNKINDLLKKL
ncbi:MAG: glycosyltransferase [Patescibacteria group bacterium]